MLKFPPRRILVAVEFTKESIFAWEAAKERVFARFDKYDTRFLAFIHFASMCIWLK